MAEEAGRKSCLKNASGAHVHVDPLLGSPISAPLCKQARIDDVAVGPGNKIWMFLPRVGLVEAVAGVMEKRW
jgi:hypothetical protein